MLKALSAPVKDEVFTATDVVGEFVFTVTGTNADGTPFSQVVTQATQPAQMDLPVGKGFVLVVKRTVGTIEYASAPSDPVDIAAPATITVSVPDSTQKAVIA